MTESGAPVQSAPFGSWPSPLSAAMLAQGGIGLSGLAVRQQPDGTTQWWWSEVRAAESGRVVLMRSVVADGATPTRAQGDDEVSLEGETDRVGSADNSAGTEADNSAGTEADNSAGTEAGSDGNLPARAGDVAGLVEGHEMLPPEFSVRSRVHEYGGGSWFLGAADAYIVNGVDQRLYRVPADGSEPIAITPEPPTAAAWRYADGVESHDAKWVICVREAHIDPDTGAELSEPRNEIVLIPTDGSEPPRVEFSGSDFVAAPRISADGRWVSWVRWDHPNMPWDGSTLCAAPIFERGRFGNVQFVAGNAQESILSANWLSDGRLLYSSDRSGRWNLHAWRPGDDRDHQLTALADAEIGSPPWILGGQAWAELPDGKVAAIVTRRAQDAIAIIDVSGEASDPVQVINEEIAAADAIAVTPDGEIAVLASFARQPQAIVSMAPMLGASLRARYEVPSVLEPEWISAAERMVFRVDPTPAGVRHAFYYPPRAPGHRGPSGAKPPLIVMGHGGPTAHATPALNLKIQYWTTRGFAVVDVNYGGSTGFGRAYRRLLNGAWGVSDVADCVAAAQSLAEAAQVDPERLVIRGGSAGGLTTLNALITTDLFAAGTSLYGVADLAALAADTHKFESRYLDQLVGRWPEDAEIYAQRSPIHHVSGLNCPLLVLQGTDDAIVPPNQADAILAAVAEKGLPHASIYFEGEQHGFRKFESIVRSLEAELWFYGRVFGFEPADRIEPIHGAVGLAEPPLAET